MSTSCVFNDKHYENVFEKVKCSERMQSCNIKVFCVRYIKMCIQQEVRSKTLVERGVIFFIILRMNYKHETMTTVYFNVLKMKSFEIEIKIV